MKTFLQKYYLMIIYVIGLINWVLNTMYVYLPFLIITMGLVLWFNLDRLKLIPLILITPFVFKSLSNNLFGVLCCTIIGLLMIYDIYNQKLFCFNSIVKSMLLILLVMIASLLTSISWLLSLKGILMFFLPILVLYYFDNIDAVNKRDYIVKNFIYLGFFIFSEIIIYFLCHIGTNFTETLETMHLGWGSYSIISLVYLMLIPISTYHYIDTRKDINIIIVFLNISITFVMMTKGSYIALLALSIPFIVQIYNHSSNKSRLVKLSLMYLIVALLIKLFISTPVGVTGQWYKRVNKLTISLENHDVLFDLGLRVFRINPIMGTGVNTSSLFISEISDDHFPNCLIQTLATLGIIGFITFLGYIYTVIKVTRGSVYNNFVMFSFIAILIQGLFESSFYQLSILIILSLLLSCLDKKKGEELCLQLN